MGGEGERIGKVGGIKFRLLRTEREMHMRGVCDTDGAAPGTAWVLPADAVLVVERGENFFAVGLRGKNRGGDAVGWAGDCERRAGNGREDKA